MTTFLRTSFFGPFWPSVLHRWKSTDLPFLIVFRGDSISQHQPRWVGQSVSGTLSGFQISEIPLGSVTFSMTPLDTGQTFYMTWDCVVSLAEMFEFLLLRKYLQFFMWRFVLFQLSYKMANVFNKKKVICASSSQVCLPHLPFSQNLSMIKRRFGQILKSDLAQCHPHTSTVEEQQLKLKKSENNSWQHWPSSFHFGLKCDKGQNHALQCINLNLSKSISLEFYCIFFHIFVILCFIFVVRCFLCGGRYISDIWLYPY